jgi:hypothetical protein
MRSAAAIVAGLALAAVLGLAVAALVDERPQAFTLGVTRSTTIEVKAGEEACQAPIDVPGDAAFDGVTFAVGTDRRPGPPLDVTVRAARPGALRGAVLARGTLTGGYPDIDRAPSHTVWVDRVPAERSIAVCVANRGRRSAFISGNADAAARSSSAFVDGAPAGSDLALGFERRSPRSLAALAPAIVDRAALFRAQVVGAWTYILLGLLVLLVAPALLVRAVTLATADES